MIYADFEHPSLENLPLRHAAFLNSLYHVGAGLSEVLTLVDYMQDPNLLDTAIPTSLATLAILSSEGQQRLSPEVQYGWSILHEYFGRRRIPFGRLGLIPTVYGSMQYGDEQNLDFDIKVLSRQEHPHIYSLADDWIMELDQEWVTDASGHIDYEPLPELERIAAAVSDDSRHEEIYQNAGIWEVSLESIAVALSGLPLFPEDATALESLRPQYYQLLFRDPIVAAVAYNALVETINERMERRG